MTQQMLNEAVARATGEDLSQICRRGFVPLTGSPYEQDEEQHLPPQVMDWDQYDLERNVAMFEQTC